MSKKRCVQSLKDLNTNVKFNIKEQNKDNDVFLNKIKQLFITPVLKCTLTDVHPFNDIDEKVVQLTPLNEEDNILLEEKLLDICDKGIDDINNCTTDNYSNREIRLLKVTSRGCGTTIEDSEYISWFVSLSNKLQIWDGKNKQRLNNIDLESTSVRAIVYLKKLLLSDYDGPLFQFVITHLEIMSEPEPEPEEEPEEDNEEIEKEKLLQALLEQQRKLGEQITAMSEK